MPNAAALVAAAAVVALSISGPGTRWGWWHFRVGLLLFAASGALALVALILAALAWRQAAMPAAAAGLVALGIAGLVGSAIAGAARKPVIHDISTDLDDPPRFRAVLPLRGRGSNPAEGITPRTAAAQRRAYADVQPRTFPEAPAAAFARALDAAKGLGWEIVASDERTGIIEATDTTRFFGFRDDIVIRVRSVETGSRVDIRSTSRVGKSDAGMNAARIRTFLAKL